MLISFFCIVYEPIIYKYPLFESIRSIIPISDEIVMIFGKNEPVINELNKMSEKIRVVITEKWNYEWNYDVMTYHFDLGLRESNGDFCVKFDIDYIFKYNDINDLRNTLKNCSEYHKIYLPKYNYLDSNHWMVFSKGIYIINKSLLNKDSGDKTEQYFIGNKNYVNELISMIDLKTYTCSDNLVKVYNYDCTFMDYDTFYDKQLNWYRAYFSKWKKLDYFGLKEEDLYDKKRLVLFVINRTKDRILNAIQKNQIVFDNFKKNPYFIKEKLLKLDKNQYGKNFFGLIDIKNLLYEKIPKNNEIIDKNIKRIKNYLEKIDCSKEILENDKAIKYFIINTMKKDLLISKFS